MSPGHARQNDRKDVLFSLALDKTYATRVVTSTTIVTFVVHKDTVGSFILYEGTPEKVAQLTIRSKGGIGSAPSKCISPT